MTENATTTGEPAAGGLGTQGILDVCTQAVEDYRGGTISKARAILVISTELVSAESLRPDTAGDVSTIRSYLAMLDERPGRERRGTDSPEPTQSSVRSRSADSGSDVGESSHKRSRPNPAHYAWAATEFLLGTQLHPDVARTLELIRLYGEDLTQAKRHVASSASAPEFPESEWANVLAGRAVDLDHVFAGRYTPGAEEKVSERVGGLEFTYRAPVVAKKVSSFGEWVYAWKRATLAITFAFPHRREELDSYGEYIIGLFGALAEPVHGRILDFDRAVRKRAGSSRRFLLTNANDFADLKIQYIDACGANVYQAEAHSHSKPSASRGSGASRQKEACRKYNAGTCANLASKCRFRHSCAGCGGDGHVESECRKAGKRV
ncbi:hypothetical protein C2E23DRAFT_723253 [Lenzites betulinus]|nr:hypothetical protein C2E23DRAFT_723253 [Lenzites betulinus]